MSDEGKPVITIEFDKTDLERMLLNGLKRAADNWSYPKGEPMAILEKKIEAWVRAYDIDSEIEAVMRNVVRSTVSQAVTSAIKKQTGEALAAMIATGEFDTMIARLVADKMRQE